MNIRKTDMSRSSIPPSLPPYLLRAKPSVVRLHLPPFHQKNNLGSQGRRPSLSKGSVEDDHTLKEGGREGRRERGCGQFSTKKTISARKAAAQASPKAASRMTIP